MRFRAELQESAPPSVAHVAGLTYASLSASDKAEIRISADWRDYLGTAIVLGLVVGLYVYFSFWTSLAELIVVELFC